MNEAPSSHSLGNLGVNKNYFKGGPYGDSRKMSALFFFFKAVDSRLLDR